MSYVRLCIKSFLIESIQRDESTNRVNETKLGHFVRRNQLRERQQYKNRDEEKERICQQKKEHGGKEVNKKYEL